MPNESLQRINLKIMSTRSLGTFIVVVWLTAWFVVSAEAQLTLTGTNYTQNFNAISNGLSATSPTVAKSWADTTGEFGN